MTNSTDRLIDGLIGDLEPVSPLPRLRSAFAIVLAVWATLLGVVLWSQEGEPAARSLLSNRVYLASFLGLLIASFGATISALASGTPGRDRLETLGMLFAFVGLAAAAAACLVGLNALGASLPGAPPGAHAMCFQKSVWLSMLPAGVILTFLVRGWAAHPVRASLVALIAAGAIGGMIVHLSCDLLSPRHILMSHLSVPVVLALLGLYPLAVVVRRIRR